MAFAGVLCLFSGVLAGPTSKPSTKPAETQPVTFVPKVGMAMWAVEKKAGMKAINMRQTCRAGNIQCQAWRLTASGVEYALAVDAKGVVRDLTVIPAPGSDAAKAISPPPTEIHEGITLADAERIAKSKAVLSSGTDFDKTYTVSIWDRSSADEDIETQYLFSIRNSTGRISTCTYSVFHHPKPGK
jgi:hypothetical protein